jgi:hypothetical protein
METANIMLMICRSKNKYGKRGKRNKRDKRKDMETNKLYFGDCLPILRRLRAEMQTSGYEKGICVVTDPPFNIGYHYKSYRDKMREAEYYKWLSEIVGDCCAVVHYPESMYRLAIEKGVPPDRVVSWVYNSNTPRQHRDIAFWGVKPDFSKVIQPYKNLTDKRIQARIAQGIGGGECMIGLT